MGLSGGGTLSMTGWELIEAYRPTADATSKTFSTGLTSYKSFMILVTFYAPSGTLPITMTFNSDGGANYSWLKSGSNNDGGFVDLKTAGTTSIRLNTTLAANTGMVCGQILINKPTAATQAGVVYSFITTRDAGADMLNDNGGATWANTADAISSITIGGGANVFSANKTTILLWGSKD